MKEKSMANRFKKYEKPISIIAGFGKVDTEHLERPFFIAPKSADDCESTMRYDSNADTYQDITQCMMMNSAQWSEALDIVAPNNTASYAASYSSTNLRHLAANALLNVLTSRVNYLANNAANILIRDIISTISEFVNDTELQAAIYSELCDKIFSHVWCATPGMLYRINDCGTSDNGDLAIAQTYSYACIVAMNELAAVTGIVYNALYMYLTAPFDTGKMQDLATALTPAFIRFRNTLKDIYLHIYTEILACDIDDPMHCYDD